MKNSRIARLLVCLTCPLLAFVQIGHADNPFGINKDGYDVPEIFHRPGEAGIGWIRLVADWRAMEPTQGQIDFSWLDAQVAAAKAAGLRILLNFYFVPSWANGSSPSCIPFLQSCSQPPTNPIYFHDFAFAVANRYKGIITHYGPWNEPNQNTFWDGDFQQYIDEILINGAQAIKLADSSAKIVGPDTVFSPGSFSHVLFDACNHLDIVSAHFYPGHFPGAAEAMFADFDSNYLPQIQNLCNKPFWITEFGVKSNLTGEAIQAAEYSDAFSGIIAKPSIDRIFIYRLEDHSPGEATRFGILGSTSEGYPPKQSFFALQALANAVSEERVITVDAAAPGFLALESGSSTIAFSPANAVVTGLPWGFPGPSPTDNKWNVENDAINGGLPGFNVFVSHGAFENSPELGISVNQLASGAEYAVYVRYGTTPANPSLDGIVARIGNSPPLRLDQTVSQKSVLRSWSSWEEWEAYAGIARVTNGKLSIFIDDTGLNTGVWSGLRLRSIIQPPAIFADGFEAGNLTAWSTSP